MPVLRSSCIIIGCVITVVGRERDLVALAEGFSTSAIASPLLRSDDTKDISSAAGNANATVGETAQKNDVTVAANGSTEPTDSGITVGPQRMIDSELIDAFDGLMHPGKPSSSDSVGNLSADTVVIPPSDPLVSLSSLNLMVPPKFHSFASDNDIVNMEASPPAFSKLQVDRFASDSGMVSMIAAPPVPAAPGATADALIAIVPAVPALGATTVASAPVASPVVTSVPPITVPVDAALRASNEAPNTTKVDFRSYVDPGVLDFISWWIDNVINSTDNPSNTGTPRFNTKNYTLLRGRDTKSESTHIADASTASTPEGNIIVSSIVMNSTDNNANTNVTIENQPNSVIPSSTVGQLSTSTTTDSSKSDMTVANLAGNLVASIADDINQAVLVDDVPIGPRRPCSNVSTENSMSMNGTVPGIQNGSSAKFNMILNISSTGNGTIRNGTVRTLVVGNNSSGDTLESPYFRSATITEQGFVDDGLDDKIFDKLNAVIQQKQGRIKGQKNLTSSILPHTIECRCPGGVPKSGVCAGGYEDCESCGYFCHTNEIGINFAQRFERKTCDCTKRHLTVFWITSFIVCYALYRGLMSQAVERFLWPRVSVIQDCEEALELLHGTSGGGEQTLASTIFSSSRGKRGAYVRMSRLGEYIGISTRDSPEKHIEFGMR